MTHTRTWRPYGMGAAQWTDYAPPARWLGMGDYVQLPYAGLGQAAGLSPWVAVGVAGLSIWAYGRIFFAGLNNQAVRPQWLPVAIGLLGQVAAVRTLLRVFGEAALAQEREAPRLPMA